jgi:hypothetical protein
MNPDLTRAVRNHIQEHIDMLRTVNPDILMLIREQPLNPIQQAGAPGLPPGPMNSQGNVPPPPPQQPMPMNNASVMNQSSIDEMYNQGTLGPQAGPAELIPNQPTVPAELLPNSELDPRAK